MINMSYKDRYPNCVGCPMAEYCDDTLASLRLCYSYYDIDDNFLNEEDYDA